MRILFLSNFYPPFSRGGYEQWCQEVAIELVRRGHQVKIITSRVADEADTIADNGVSVERCLSLELEGGLLETVQRVVYSREKLEQANLAKVRQLIEKFQPDVALIWGMWNVPRSVPALVEALLPNRVAYYLCDYWLSLPNAYIQRWQDSSKRQITQLPKQLLSKVFLHHLEKEDPIPLNLEHPICVSQAVRDILVQAGTPIEHAQIIYGGTQIDDFVAAAQNRPPKTATTLKMVYIGRLVADKGVHTIIEALGNLTTKQQELLKFDIIGHGNTAYVQHLKKLVQNYHLESVVSFRGSVPRANIPTVLAEYDALIFSSEWEEPFARTPLEAMAAGLAVIGTTTGGTGEILIHGETGLTYPAGNPNTLATQIQQLVTQPALQKKLAHAGQQRVIKNFTFTRMADELEATLHAIMANSSKINNPIFHARSL